MNPCSPTMAPPEVEAEVEAYPLSSDSHFAPPVMGVLPSSAIPGPVLEKPTLSLTAPRGLTTKQLESFGSTLPPEVKDVLNNTNGKPTIDISFCGEYRLRHVLPFIFDSGYLEEDDLSHWSQAYKLVATYRQLKEEYGHLDPSPLRGYGMYENFADETELNQDCIKTALNWPRQPLSSVK